MNVMDTSDYKPIDLGFSTADADEVSLHFESGTLLLAFRDWREQQIKCAFNEVLAFKWDSELDMAGIRADIYYEVSNSLWLQAQAEAQGVNVGDYTHYKLCFNAQGAQDVLCAKQVAGLAVIPELTPPVPHS